MTSDLAGQKKALRLDLRARLKALTSEERRFGSLAACDQLRAQPLWRAAGCILFYAPLSSELDLAPLLAEALATGKTAALPGYVAATGLYEAFVITHLTDDCAPGRFGIAEPKPGCARLPLNRLDLALTPGVGFDETGHRLGRGQGFYDRLLAQTAAIKCGVAFDLQVVERIPAEPHDIRMNCLLTPTRWRELAPSHAS
ncbi:MAG TPA: 5-formyltetrahydrofolate cyclo-ligase [Verrucomicrobiae bacterium]|jgi:5-formyltetrahydrofolate cyclo-ligase|nr:5-formyltetrahydrofolate cyclo-ligase [Verrucomicrobiae bacterium]